MGGNAPTHGSHQSRGWVPGGSSGPRRFPNCSASTSLLVFLQELQEILSCTLCS